MIVHVCGSDGQQIGVFEEQDFIGALFGSRFPSDSYYWHEGMEDWKPVAEYRALAKTQRISFAPPRTRTVKIDMDSLGKSDIKAQPERRNALANLWARIKGADKRR